MEPTDGGPIQQQPQARPPAGSTAQPGHDELIYAGPAKHGAYAWDYLKWVLVGALCGAVGTGLGYIPALAGYPLWLLSFVGLFGIVGTFLKHATSRFKLTLRRIELERGILSKSIDSLELWRVLDLKYTQNVFDRILGVGRITVMSTDQSTPELVLYGLPNGRAIFERLRDAVQIARHTSRPMELVGGEHGLMENVGH
jgi:membrane protein YdbS with pleckstrin-like domain